MADEKPKPKPKPIATLGQLLTARPELKRAERRGSAARVIGRAAGALVLALLFGCGGGPGDPGPTPPPTPPPGEVPDGCRLCGDLAAASATATELQRVQDPVPGRFLVEYAGRLNAFSNQETAEVRSFAEGLGATDVEVLAHGFAGTLSLDRVDELAADPRYLVQQVNAYDVGPFEPRWTSAAAASWGLGRVVVREGIANAFMPAEGATGAGIDCIVIDTGEPRDSRAEWGARLQEGRSAVTTEDRFDYHGHSTHVSGTFAGYTFGIARECRVTTIKALDRNGSGTTVTVIRAIDLAVEYCSAEGRRCVVNFSLGSGVDPAFDRALCGLAKVAAIAGAAGNDYGRDACNTSPGGVFDGVATVGASQMDDTRAVFSNRGPGIQLYAPGVRIKSIGGEMDGTSMASPHVAGIMAALWSIFTADTPQEVMARAVRVATAIRLGRLAYIGPEVLN